MERIVYILGAGFSAPLGLPVVRNFLTSAKDLYFTDPVRYGYFDELFGRIDELARLKNVFRADLLDIEEILSILEFDGAYAGGLAREKFVQLIKDVILAYTPPLQPPQRPGNWAPYAFGPSPLAGHYGYLVADLCGFQLRHTGGGPKNGYVCVPQEARSHSYGVITLNYDRVLESVWDYVTEHYDAASDRSFLLNGIDSSSNARCSLAKLHGTVEGGDLIPPTSAKLISGVVKEAWNTAFKLLREANHIRVIGYSLPPTDTMVRYLLKASVARARHLKSFHVLCRDNEQQLVQSRYNEFVDFKFFRFRDMSVELYLYEQWQNSAGRGMGNVQLPDQLERTHSSHFG